MNRMISSPETIHVNAKKWKRFVRASQTLLDLTESILEEHGSYKKEFIRGLAQSQKERHAGNVRRVHSLLDVV